MTADSARLDHLVRRIQSGDATSEEQDEWLRLRIAKAEKRLKSSEKAFTEASDQWVAQATSDLRERILGLTGAEMIEAGRRFFPDFERQWGEEAAREAWKAEQPPKRQGRAKWRSIPPARPRGYHTSAQAHFRRFSQAKRADLLATTPTKPGRTLSKEEAAAHVLGYAAANPDRQIRRIKRRPRNRD